MTEGFEIVSGRQVVAIFERGNTKLSGDLGAALNSLFVRETQLPGVIRCRKEWICEGEVSVDELRKIQEEFTSFKDSLATTRFELAFLRGEDLGKVDEEAEREFSI